MHRDFAARACVRLLALCLSAGAVDALHAQNHAPLPLHPQTADDDPLAALRTQEQLQILKDLTAAHGPGLVPPTTSATILNYHLPGGGLHRRMVISRPKNFSLSMNEQSGEIHFPADGPAPHGGPTVDCTGPATITVLARELSSHEIGLGDMNCDGVLDNADVSPLALALVDPSGYAAAYAGCNPLNADLALDGVLNGRDILPFVERLLAPVASDVPVRLRYRLGAGPYQDLMGGQDVLVNDSDTLTLTQGEELILAARMAWPGFSAPTLTREVLSNSVTNVMILVNGDNYPQMAALMGVQNPYGSQQSVAAILGPEIMDPNTGVITLPENQAIQFFELGTNNVNSPAFDMQDLVLLMTTNCDIPQEVVLRDSIGVDNTTTNDNFPFGTYKISNNTHYVIPAVVTASNDLTLSSLRLVVAKMTSPLIWNNYNYHVRVWSDLATAINQPLSGNIANVFLDAPSYGPNVWGQTAVMAGIGSVASYEIGFDLSSAGIVLNAGETRAIGISITTDGCNGGSGQSGCLGIMETTELGDSDTQISPLISGGSRLLSSSSFSRWDGRVAWDIRGLSN